MTGPSPSLGTPMRQPLMITALAAAMAVPATISAQGGAELGDRPPSGLIAHPVAQVAVPMAPRGELHDPRRDRELLERMGIGGIARELRDEDAPGAGTGPDRRVDMDGTRGPRRAAVIRAPDAVDDARELASLAARALGQLQVELLHIRSQLFVTEIFEY